LDFVSQETQQKLQNSTTGCNWLQQLAFGN